MNKKKYLVPQTDVVLLKGAMLMVVASPDDPDQPAGSRTGGRSWDDDEE